MAFWDQTWAASVQGRCPTLISLALIIALFKLTAFTILMYNHLLLPSRFFSFDFCLWVLQCSRLTQGSVLEDDSSQGLGNNMC